MFSRAQTLAHSLLEAGPDDVDPRQAIRNLPSMEEFVLREVGRRIVHTEGHGYFEVHNEFRKILEEALEFYTMPASDEYAALFSAGMDAIEKKVGDFRTMEADDARDAYGNLLIGVKIETEEYGDYPGGLATITQVTPDEEAEEIAFQVHNPLWTDDDDPDDHTIGVFSSEIIQFA